MQSAITIGALQSLIWFASYWITSLSIARFERSLHLNSNIDDHSKEKGLKYGQDNLLRIRRVALFNQLFLIFPSLLCYSMILYSANSNISFSPLVHLYTFYEGGILRFLVRFFFLILTSDITMYTLHRFAHLPLLYKWIHKQHHEFSYPEGSSAIHCSVGEMLLINIPTVLFPLVFLRSTSSVLRSSELEKFCWMNLWLAFTAMETVISHSRILQDHLPSCLQSHHDLHHSNQKNNFGTSLGFMDRIFQTASSLRTRMP